MTILTILSWLRKSWLGRAVAGVAAALAAIWLIRRDARQDALKDAENEYREEQEKRRQAAREAASDAREGLDDAADDDLVERLRRDGWGG